MTPKLCLLFSLVFLLCLQHSSLLAQSNRNKSSKVIVPTIEYVKDGFEKRSKKDVSRTTYGTGAILLKNRYEDLFEEYEGKAVIDKKPQYKLSRNTYILEKVVYTKTEIIFSLAIYFAPDTYLNAVFYPTNHKYSWFLKDLSTGKKYFCKSVRRIQKNGTLESQQLDDFPLTILADEKTQTVFTCRVHFDRLPNSSREVHLIEGRGKAKDKNHFNFFNIKLKTEALVD
jgi:hypothetical protein